MIVPRRLSNTFIPPPNTRTWKEEAAASPLAAARALAAGLARGGTLILLTSRDHGHAGSPTPPALPCGFGLCF